MSQYLKLIPLIAAGLLASFVAIAEAPSGEEIAERMTNKMNERLDLDESQLQSISEINASYASQFESLREEHRGNMKSLLASRDAEITPLLNEEQLQQYEKDKERMKDNMRGKHRKHFKEHRKMRKKREQN